MRMEPSAGVEGRSVVLVDASVLGHREQPLRRVVRFLVVRDAAGFVDRFDELYAVAYRASFVVLGDRHEAEDCAQEAMARALDRWERIDGHATAWVARSATNAAIDRWRRRRRSEPTAKVIDRASVNDVEIRRDELVAVLRMLPRRQREAVVLRHLLDLTERDTATAMGCSTGTVKSASARGLARLREALATTWALEA